MKKLLCILIALTSIIIFPATVSASTGSNVTQYSDEMVLVNTETQYMSDGSKIIIETYEQVSIATRSSYYEKTGFKSFIYKNSINESLWKFTIYGVFSIESGVRATCTGVSYSSTIYSSSWQLNSASCNSYYDEAYGTGVYKKRFLGIVIETREANISLTCDGNGNFS